MKQTMIAALAAMALGGCATAGSAPEAPAAMTCNAASAQSHLGQQASQAVGAAILRDSGARTLRWGPPGGAWTMDFREDRVNVRYDEASKITDITCG